MKTSHALLCYGALLLVIPALATLPGCGGSGGGDGLSITPIPTTIPGSGQVDLPVLTPSNDYNGTTQRITLPVLSAQSQASIGSRTLNVSFANSSQNSALNMSLSKPGTGAFAVGDTFSIDTCGNAHAIIAFREGNTASRKFWEAASCTVPLIGSGTVRIVSISANGTYTVALENVRLQKPPGADITSAGSFTLNGNVTFVPTFLQ